MHFGYDAAALAFFTIISLIPLGFATSTILSYLPISARDIVSELDTLMPKMPFDSLAFLADVTAYLKSNQGVSMVISFLMAYYFSSSLFLAFRSTLDQIFGFPQRRHHQVVIKLLSVPILILIVLGVHMALWIISAGVHLLTIFPGIGDTIQFLGALNFIVYFLILYLIYHWFCPRKPSGRGNSLVISLVLAIVFSIAKVCFSKIFAGVSIFNPVYASFGGIFGFLFWIYIAYLLVLIGARVLYYLDLS